MHYHFCLCQSLSPMAGNGSPRRGLNIINSESFPKGSDPRQRLRDILGRAPEGNSPRHRLRRVLSLPQVQDEVFGDHAPGGLEWDDYINLTPYIGPVLHDQGRSIDEHDRIFPLRCAEWRTDENGDRFQCNQDADQDLAVWRCMGLTVDPGHRWGRPNPLFPDNAPCNVQLRYPRPEDVFKKWDAPTVWLEHKEPSHPVCQDCRRDNYRRCIRDWLHRWSHDSVHTNPNLQRWFRLCKKHTTIARNARMHRPGVHLSPDCHCTARSRALPRCDNCQREAQNPWNDRAQEWRRELSHTYKKQGRYRRPYVDLNKPARVRPVCAWKGCGGRAWCGTLESDRTGLSVCLACSQLITA